MLRGTLSDGGAHDCSLEHVTYVLQVHVYVFLYVYIFAFISPMTKTHPDGGGQKLTFFVTRSCITFHAISLSAGGQGRLAYVASNPALCSVVNQPHTSPNHS